MGLEAPREQVKELDLDSVDNAPQRILKTRLEDSAPRWAVIDRETAHRRGPKGNVSRVTGRPIGGVGLPYGRAPSGLTGGSVSPIGLSGICWD